MSPIPIAELAEFNGMTEPRTRSMGDAARATLAHSPHGVWRDGLPLHLDGALRWQR